MLSACILTMFFNLTERYIAQRAFPSLGVSLANKLIERCIFPNKCTTLLEQYTNIFHFKKHMYAREERFGKGEAELGRRGESNSGKIISQCGLLEKWPSRVTVHC